MITCRRALRVLIIRHWPWFVILFAAYVIGWLHGSSTGIHEIISEIDSHFVCKPR